MSLNSKPRALLSVAFILTTVSAISVSAQTQTAVGSNPSRTILRPDSTTEPKKVEATKPYVADAESIAADQIAEVNKEKDSSVVRGVTAPVTTTEPRSETVTAPRPQSTPNDGWQFQVTPYFWLSSLHGTGGVGNRTAEVDMSFGDIFGSLKFALMGVFEARKGKFMLLTDMEYVHIEDDKATPGPLFSDVNAKFKVFIFDPEVGYRLYENPDSGSSVDVLGGIRVWHVSTELDFGAGILPATQLQGSRNWVDAIVGLRGKAAVSEKIFVTGKADLGGGGSQFTWQLFGGLGYSITPNIALIGGYRVLDVDYDKNNFIYDMNQRGPILGIGFKF